MKTYSIIVVLLLGMLWHIPQISALLTVNKLVSFPSQHVHSRVLLALAVAESSTAHPAKAAAQGTLPFLTFCPNIHLLGGWMAGQQVSTPTAGRASSRSVASGENGSHQIYSLLPEELEAKNIRPSPDPAWLSLPSRFILYLQKRIKVLNNLTWAVLAAKSLPESLTQQCYTLCWETGANGGNHSLQRQEKGKKQTKNPNKQFISIYVLSLALFS